MAPFKIGDYVRRLDEDISRQGLEKRGVYVIASCYDIEGKGSLQDFRVQLVGFAKKVWDAFRFELVNPPYVQACPCGIHWTECSTHKDGNK